MSLDPEMGPEFPLRALNSALYALTLGQNPKDGYNFYHFHQVCVVSLHPAVKSEEVPDSQPGIPHHLTPPFDDTTSLSVLSAVFRRGTLHFPVYPGAYTGGDFPITERINQRD